MNKTMQTHKQIYYLISLVALCSCNPNLYEPEVAIPNAYTALSGIDNDTVGANNRWWLLFDDARLDSLQDRALLANRDINSAMSSVVEAMYAMKGVRSSHYPELDFDIDIEAEEEPTEGRINSFTLSRTISWKLPLSALWREQNRAAQAELLAADWAAYGMLLTVTAEVAKSYYNLAGYRDQYLIAQRTHALRRQSEAIIDSMYRYGFSSRNDVERARMLTAEAVASMATLSENIEHTEHALAALVGDTPSNVTHIATISTISEEALPPTIAIGQPADLLFRRPDIMKARREMDAARARVGEARFNRFPVLSVSGSGGIYGSSVKEFFRLDKLIWSAASTLMAPAIGFGRLRRVEKQAIEEYRQAAYAYEQCVINAFKEVEDLLSTIASLRTELDASRTMVSASSKALELTRALYEGGMSPIGDYIDAERDAYSAQLNLSSCTVALYEAYIGLIEAIGGGWRSDTTDGNKAEAP